VSETIGCVEDADPRAKRNGEVRMAEKTATSRVIRLEAEFFGTVSGPTDKKTPPASILTGLKSGGDNDPGGPIVRSQTISGLTTGL